jgi:GntR family transcriptional repressor for pyruvate dehydrogenase complex
MIAALDEPSVETLPEQVAKSILGRIASGELRPGDQLPPHRELARLFDVGLSVVREAIQRLEVLKILETRQGIGTVVRPFQWMQLIYDPDLFMVGHDLIKAEEFWEARHAIERETIRLAVLRATAADLAAMAEVLEAAVPDPTDHDVHMGLNRAFHLAIARASGNGVLVDILAPLLDVRLPWAARNFSTIRAQEAWAVHRQMYRAIVAGDVQAAFSAIEAHAEVGSTLLEELDDSGKAATSAAAPNGEGAGRRRSRSRRSG